jgi:exosortase H (IPTLxxWG-CTERM-specific)
MGKSGKASRLGPKDAPKKKIDSDPRRRRLVVFVATFLGLLLIGAILYPYFSIAAAEPLRDFMAVTAHICAGFLDTVSDNVTVDGRFLSYRGFSVEIIEECTGVFEMLIFLAALLSYPASWKAKGIGFVLGIPALYLFNIIRIVFLTVVGVYQRTLFDFMHLYFWQGTLILMITSVWVLWILLVVGREKKSPAFLS